jgi:membrane protease subunit (stomatin/prohibitin family)
MKTNNKSSVIVREIRDAYIAQLPIIAALLAMGEEVIDFNALAADAIELCRAIEEELQR